MLSAILKRKSKNLKWNNKVTGDQNLFDLSQKLQQEPDSLKLNIGCGTDIRKGFVNIDGSDELPNVDKIIDISKQSLLDHFEKGSVSYILANDIIEHHYHWEAVKLLTQFYKLLKKDGICEVRVPDCEYIISSDNYTSERKLVLLFGGQDIPQGVDAKMDESRKIFPQFFCHKYGWSMERMNTDLKKIGFTDIAMKGADSNFVTIARKK